MKNLLTTKSTLILAFLTFGMLFSSCQAIGSIFRAGVWAGVILVVLVIALVIWIISSILGRK